jgi:Ca-activated chloride channel family protein
LALLGRAAGLLIPLLSLTVFALAEDVGVLLIQPEAAKPTVGTTELEAEAWPAGEVERVEFRVDGKSVGEVGTPPYRLTVDLGASATGHQIEAVAYGRDGSSARHEVRTAGIHIDLELDLPLQQLYVTVSRGDQPVHSLDRSRFEIRDEGKPQEIVTFERGDVPLTSVLLVDSSLSMRGGRLGAALQGVRTFVRGMKEHDEAKVTLFSDRLLHTTPFTRFPEILTAGLDTVSAAGGTAVNDFLYQSLKELEGRQGRRVVVILSDGVDVESVLEMKDVLWKVHHSQALIYWLRLHRPGKPLLDEGALVRQHSVWRDAEEHGREFRGLEEAVRASGGRITDLHRPEEIAPAFEELMQELRGQYVLGYYPKNLRRDGSWRRIRVTLRDGQGLEVRVREGYVDL